MHLNLQNIEPNDFYKQARSDALSCNNIRGFKIEHEGEGIGSVESVVIVSRDEGRIIYCDGIIASFQMGRKKIKIEEFHNGKVKSIFLDHSAQNKIFIDSLDQMLYDQRLVDFRRHYLTNRKKLLRESRQRVLTDYWTLRKNHFEKRGDDCFKKLYHQIGQPDLDVFRFEYKKLRKTLNKRQRLKLLKLHRQDLDDRRQRKLLKCYKNRIEETLFEDATKLYQQYRRFIPQAEWDKVIHDIIKEYSCCFWSLLDECRFFEAREYIDRRKQILRLEPELYEALQYLIKTTEKLSCFKFKNAEPLLSNTPIAFREQALEHKAYFLAKFLENKYGFSIDQKQARAIASPQNTIVCARAGSGKTRTIVARIAFLIGGLEVDPHEILILVFNRKAASEIRQRLQALFPRLGRFNVRTFHSLAYVIAPPSGEILFDGDGDFSRQRLSEYVQRLTRKIWRPDIRLKLYMWFRDEMEEIDLNGLGFRTDDDYYLYRRSMRQTTLGGESVKSKGEKWIADFLLEHNLGYRYEQPHQWGDRIYRPDFTLLDQMKVVIEHWGIDQHDHGRRVPDHWDQRWDEYLIEMQEKRQYWKTRPDWTLVETSVSDMKNSREDFEAILKDRLEQASHTNLNRLSRKEIIEKVGESHITRMTKLFVQFIMKAKKRELDLEKLYRRFESHKDELPERIARFTNLALYVLKEYEKKLKAEGKTDFDTFLLNAATNLSDDSQKREIRIHGTNTRLPIASLKHILIDEYQDFSLLFDHLIKKIRNLAPESTIFCVGDDWQAINNFAGSDLRFFHGFLENIPGSDRRELKTNYRSGKLLVEVSNSHMSGLGTPAEYLNTNSQGSIEVCDVTQEIISWPPKTPESSDKAYMLLGDDEKTVCLNAFMLARYFKLLHKTLITHNQQLGSIALLSRTNSVYGIDLNTFLGKLLSIMQDVESENPWRERIEISSVHGFKGKEADTVFLLRCTGSHFPLIHPDNELFQLLGDTPQTQLEEERRLFYVALTRAKTNLFILTESDDESPFLKHA